MNRTTFRAAMLLPVTLKGPSAMLRAVQALGAAVVVFLASEVPAGLDLALPLAGFLLMTELALLARRLRREG